MKISLHCMIKRKDKFTVFDPSLSKKPLVLLILRQ